MSHSLFDETISHCGRKKGKNKSTGLWWLLFLSIKTTKGQVQTICLFILELRFSPEFSWWKFPQCCWFLRWFELEYSVCSSGDKHFGWWVVTKKKKKLTSLHLLNLWLILRFGMVQSSTKNSETVNCLEIFWCVGKNTLISMNVFNAEFL